MAVSPGQMNLASIISGLTRGLSEGLAFKRQHEMDLAKQRGMTQYRQAQLGMERKRLKLAEDRAQLVQEEAEYKASIRPSKKEVKEGRVLERRKTKKLISQIGKRPEETEFGKTYSIAKINQDAVESNVAEIKQLNIDLMSLQGQYNQAAVLKNKPLMESLEGQINQNRARIDSLRRSTDALRKKGEKSLDALNFLENKATSEEKNTVKALEGKSIEGQSIDQDQAASLIMAIKSADQARLDEIFEYLRQNKMIGTRVNPSDYQLSIRFKTLIGLRQKELGGR